MFNDDFIKKIFSGELKNGQIHDGYYFDVAQKLTDAIAQGINIKQFDVNSPITKLFEKFKNNVYAFSAAKSLTAMQAMSSALKDDKGEPVSYTTFRDKVTEVDKEFNDVYLKTEYSSAKAKAQMGAKWQKLQQYDMLEYRTVGDNKVRNAHRLLDGTVLPSNDPLWAKIYPPNDWNCRCTVIPAQGATQANREKAKLFSDSPALKPYFKTNSGIEHVAFNEEEHPYFEKIKQFKTGVNKQIELMAEVSYNMPSVTKIMANKNLPEFVQPQTKEQAQELWKANNKKVKTIDGLEWNFTDRWEHVVNEHDNENRWKYINQTKDVLENADEVWMSKEFYPNNETKTYKRYLKYYKGQPIVFSYNINEPEYWTIFSSDLDETGQYKLLRDRTRRGILIHRK